MHTTGDIVVDATMFTKIYLRNTLLASTNEVTGMSAACPGSFVSSQKHDQTAGLHKTWMYCGTNSTDAVITNSTPLSLRMTPLSATKKLESAPLYRGFKVPVPSGQTASISIAVRKSVAGDGTAYNGNQPRLIVRKNAAVGMTADAVIATAVSDNGVWEILSGTTPVAIGDNVTFDCVVECDGTNGWINVDNRAAT